MGSFLPKSSQKCQVTFWKIRRGYILKIWKQAPLSPSHVPHRGKLHSVALKVSNLSLRPSYRFVLKKPYLLFYKIHPCLVICPFVCWLWIPFHSSHVSANLLGSLLHLNQISSILLLSSFQVLWNISFSVNKTAWNYWRSGSRYQGVGRGESPCLCSSRQREPPGGMIIMI